MKNDAEYGGPVLLAHTTDIDEPKKKENKIKRNRGANYARMIGRKKI